MIWTAVQIGITTGLGSVIEKTTTSLSFGAAAYIANAAFGNPLEKVGHILHTPERIMFGLFDEVLRTTSEVVDEVNDSSLNLLDGLYSTIYE